MRVRPEFWLLVLAALGLQGYRTAAEVCLCALWHELGHITALLCLGSGAESITLGGFGAEIRPAKVLSYKKEAAAALAGPLFSFAAAVLLAEFRQFELAGMNFSLFAFNMLPAEYLDGGRAAFAIIACRSYCTAEKFISTATLAVCALCTILGGAAMCCGGNFTLLLSGMWIFGEMLRDKRIICKAKYN